MLQGDPTEWLRLFRGVEQRLLDVIPTVWSKCSTGLGAQPREDRITQNLVFYLKRNARARKLGAIHCQLMLLEQQKEGDVTAKGYIDMAVVLGSDADCYVAFECKRLNVNFDSGYDSLAGQYIEKGMMRYISAQYALELPLGAMIGYVLDGDLVSAEARIFAAIARRNAMLRGCGPPVSRPSLASMRRFTTSHLRAGENLPFEIWHSLLPYPAPQ